MIPGDRRAFTKVELIAAVLVLSLVALLPGVMRQRWNGDGLKTSLNNVRQLLAACASYRMDNAERVPMRGCSYQHGQITDGFDTWVFAGKNCDSYWQTADRGVFDDKAYWRPLNPYLEHPAIPPTIGSINAGAGPTWTFDDGSITPQQRAALQVNVCRSPGDVSTRQRSFPGATAGISCYDDVGTSYQLNLVWWAQNGWPPDMTAHYDAGTERIRQIKPLDVPKPFAWITDQNATVIANTGWSIPGEFGGMNMSVMGFLTGEAAYVPVTPGAMAGSDYTFMLRP